MKGSKEPSINLLAYRREEQLERRGNFRNVAIAGLIAVFLLGGIGTAWWFQKKQVAMQQIEIKQFQQQIDSLTKKVGNTVDKNTIVLDKNKSQDSRQAMLSNLEAAAQVKSKQLREIYQLSIPEITIGKLDMKVNNELAMSAYCNNQASFITFLGQLRELEYIKEVKNISSQYNEKTREVNFNLTLVWEVE